MSANPDVTYIGILEGGVLRSGRILRTPPLILGIDSDRGMVSALTPDDLNEGRYLEVGDDGKTVREVRYYRDRRSMGHPVPNWYHPTKRTLISPTGAVSSPSARVCDLDGDFICGG